MKKLAKKVEKMSDKEIDHAIDLAKQKEFEDLLDIETSRSSYPYGETAVQLNWFSRVTVDKYNGQVT